MQDANTGMCRQCLDPGPRPQLHGGVSILAIVITVVALGSLPACSGDNLKFAVRSKSGNSAPVSYITVHNVNPYATPIRDLYLAYPGGELHIDIIMPGQEVIRRIQIKRNSGTSETELIPMRIEYGELNARRPGGSQTFSVSSFTTELTFPVDGGNDERGKKGEP